MIEDCFCCVKALTFGRKHALTHKHYGRALKFLYKQQDEKNSRDLDDRLLEVSSNFSPNPCATLKWLMCFRSQMYRLLGWEHVATLHENNLHHRYPTSYRPF